MSVGRQLCHRMIDVAQDMRRYGELLNDWRDNVDARALRLAMLELARRLEYEVPPILAFEGETQPALMAAREPDPDSSPFASPALEDIP